VDYSIFMVVMMVLMSERAEKRPRATPAALPPPFFVGTALMSTHASILVDSVGPPSAEVCKTAARFP
jgi:hypothetical protein